MQLRVGNGLDFHRLIEDRQRPLMLGGVEIPGKLALKGHSDADLVLHALCDAILGAIGMGDIGEHFPDSDPRLENMNSVRILEFCLTKMHQADFEFMNVDITLIGERPKLRPHRPVIRQRLATLLQIDTNCVGLKATTTETMGALGRSEGLGCLATVLLCKR